MWGHFRLEWEHIKYSTKNLAGFYDFNNLATSTTLTIIHNNIHDTNSGDLEMNEENIKNYNNETNNPNNFYNGDNNDDDEDYDSNNENIDFGRELEDVIRNSIYIPHDVNKSIVKKSIASNKSIIHME